MEGVGRLQGLHVDVGALRRAALVRVAGVERARVVRSDGGRELIHQWLDVFGVNQRDLRGGEHKIQGIYDALR